MSDTFYFKILNEFSAKAFLSSLTEEPDFDYLEELRLKIRFNDDLQEKSISMYYFQKVIFEKYMRLYENSGLLLFDNSLHDFLSFLMESTQELGRNLDSNYILRNSLILLREDDISMKRIIRIEQSNYVVGLLSFHFYFATRNNSLKKKLKDISFKRIAAEIQFVKFNSFSANLKDDIFEQSKSQFMLDYLGKGFDD